MVCIDQRYIHRHSWRAFLVELKVMDYVKLHSSTPSMGTVSKVFIETKDETFAIFRT